MNKVSITGRIANDLDIRKTQSNKSILEVSVAVSRERKNEDGKYPADFINVHLWEQKAEFLNNYAKKGTTIGITGRLETNNYVNKNGQRVYQVYILAESVEILNQPKEKESDETSVDSSKFGGTNLGFEQDDLPFY